MVNHKIKKENNGNNAEKSHKDYDKLWEGLAEIDANLKVLQDEMKVSVDRKEYEQRHTDLMVRITTLEGQVINMATQIQGLKATIDERAITLGTQLEKAESVLNERLASMNQFREQLNSERGNFVTKDQLNLTLKPLQDQQQYDKGRNTTIYAGIALAISVVTLLYMLFH